MRNRRYEFHQDENQTLTLVFDTVAGRWSVEVWGPKLKQTAIPIDQFERSEDGAVHAEALLGALRRAAFDA